jgi:hypothetical protein
MKDVFKGYYSVEESVLKELWANEKTLFVFDTNVLLNLYGYAKQTRGDFFNILQAVNEKLWIPYHVGLEYQRRRLSIIKNEKTVFNDIEINLGKIQKIFKGDFEKLALKRRFPKLFENTEKLEKEINKSILNYKKSVQHWDSEQPCVRSHDEIRDRLNSFFNTNIGDKPESQEWLDELYKDGEERFKKKVPPGFKDAGKANANDDTHFHNDGLYYERQYGDLILWNQLIDKAKSESVENVIFITDDAKEDWWYKISSNGEKIIGPLAELQSEIYRESNIKNFHMYSTSTFLEDGKSNLAVDVSESSIEDASTPHFTESSNSLTSKQLSEIANTYRNVSLNNEQLRGLAKHVNQFSSFDDEHMKELAKRVNKVSSFDNKNMRLLAERANKMSSFDNEQMRELVKRVNKMSSFDNKQLREIDEIQRSYQLDYESISRFLRKSDEGDES